MTSLRTAPLSSAPRRPSTRPSRVAAIVGGVAIAALALTGCIKVDADVTVNSDATGSGTFALELQKEAAQFLGISDLASFESQLNEGDLAGGGIGEFDSCESSESDTGFVYTCTFTDLAFTDPEDGPWTITKEGDLLTFRMQSNAADTGATEDAATADLLGDTSMGSINVDVTFPGPITSVTGAGATKTSDTTATVSGSLTENIDATITAESSSSGGIAALLIVLITAAVLVLIVVVAVLLIVRRRKAGAASEPAATAAATAVPAAAAAEGTTAATGDLAATEVAETVETVEEAPATEVIETVETVEEAPATEVIETIETVEEAPATGVAEDAGAEDAGEEPRA